MSAVADAGSRASGGRITWAQVQDGIHVASRAGEYVGFAERTADGHFVGFDARSTPVGRYADLPEAKSAVVQTRAHAEAATRWTGAGVALQAAAAATGLVAIATFVTAMVSAPGL